LRALPSNSRVLYALSLPVNKNRRIKRLADSPYKSQQALGRSPAEPDLCYTIIINKFIADYSIYTKEYSLPKMIKGRKLRVDTTVVEANITHPTDAGLLYEGVKKLTKAVTRIKQSCGKTTRQIIYNFQSDLRTN